MPTDNSSFGAIAARDGPPQAMANMFVPGTATRGTRFISRQGLHTTISNLPYASVTDMKSAEAGPHVPSLVCDCGQANPDGCVPVDSRTTKPYLVSSLTRSYMLSAADSAPYMGDMSAKTPTEPLNATQDFLRRRASPPGL